MQPSIDAGCIAKNCYNDSH